MSKHTPGPWGPRSWPDMVGTEQMLIASVYPPRSENPEVCEANARLIASAPDLLYALDRLLMSADVRDAADAGALNQARAAIAKATGEAA